MKWKPTRGQAKKLFGSIPILLVLFLVNGYNKKAVRNSNEVHIRSRNLLETKTNASTAAPMCIPPSIYDFPEDFFTQEQRAEGGVVIHFLISLYLIAGLAIICDDFFVSSLESICDKLHLKPDVAGATFMAAGSSAPEFFTSLIGVFIVEGDVGVGTIVGSAVFNILAVTSVCGLIATTAIPLEIWPIIRDCAAYNITVLALILVLSDNVVTWYEGLILVVLFCMYIILMYFNGTLDSAFNERTKTWKWMRYTPPEDAEKSPLLVEQNADEIEHRVRTTSRESGMSQTLIESAIIHEKVAEREKVANENPDGHPVWSMPHHGALKQIQWVLLWPLSFIFYITIPDCRLKFWENFFILTFIMSIVWLGVLSYVIVWMVTIIGFTLGIPDTIMGLTLLAIGTSLPEIVASAIVTREGLGNMAIGNNIGSNVFDILFCLGLPWFLKAAISSENIVIQSGGLLYSSLMLLATVFMFLFALWVTSWKLNKSLGLASAVLYAIFLTFAILYELNVFGEFNLPPCV